LPSSISFFFNYITTAKILIHVSSVTSIAQKISTCMDVRTGLINIALKLLLKVETKREELLVAFFDLLERELEDPLRR